MSTQGKHVRARRVQELLKQLRSAPRFDRPAILEQLSNYLDDPEVFRLFILSFWHPEKERRLFALSALAPFVEQEQVRAAYLELLPEASEDIALVIAEILSTVSDRPDVHSALSAIYGDAKGKLRTRLNKCLSTTEVAEAERFYILQGLASEVVERRRRALSKVETYLADRNVRSAAIALIADPNRTVSQQAERVLANHISPTERQQELRKLARTGAPKVRIVALKKLVFDNDPGLRKILLEHIGDPDTRIRSFAIEHMTPYVHEPLVRDTLLDVLDAEKDLDIRIHLLEMLEPHSAGKSKIE